MKYYYKTILQNTQHEIPKIKWSKFIWNIFHITNKKDVDKHIKEIQEKHKDATHNCYAYTYWTNINFDLFGNMVINPEIFKENDNWEPKNTAWKPILSQIEWSDLNNVLLIVTRYFWWILLWIWWLIQAYSECAKQTILNSKIENIEITEKYKITFEYKDIWTIMNILKKYETKIIKENSQNTWEIIFEINKWFTKNFKDQISQYRFKLSKTNN